MAQCIAIDEAGAVVALASPAGECPGYVLLTGAEYVAVSISQGIFAMPTVEETATYVGTPIAAGLFMYVIARCVGGMVNMFRT